MGWRTEYDACVPAWVYTSGVQDVDCSEGYISDYGIWFREETELFSVISISTNVETSKPDLDEHLPG